MMSIFSTIFDHSSTGTCCIPVAAMGTYPDTCLKFFRTNGTEKDPDMEGDTM
jgi:hypothetical protein